MTALDTNVVVRLLTGDDAAQQNRARSFIAAHCSAREPAFVNRIVSIETVWVLERAYGYSREQISGALDRLLHASIIAFEDRDCVLAALEQYKAGAGFADALIAETCGPGTTIVTFDEKASQRIAAFKQL